MDTFQIICLFGCLFCLSWETISIRNALTRIEKKLENSCKEVTK